MTRKRCLLKTNSLWSSSAVLEDGQYSLNLPFRKANLSLPNNKAVAQQRAQNVLKRFKKDQKFFGDNRDLKGVIVKDMQKLYLNWNMKIEKCDLYYIMESITHVQRPYMWCLIVCQHMVELP